MASLTRALNRLLRLPARAEPRRHRSAWQRGTGLRGSHESQFLNWQRTHNGTRV